MKPTSLFKSVLFLFISVLLLSACSSYKTNLLDTNNRIFKNYKYNYSFSIPEGYNFVKRNTNDPVEKQLIEESPSKSTVFFNKKKQQALIIHVNKKTVFFDPEKFEGNPLELPNRSKSLEEEREKLLNDLKNQSGIEGFDIKNADVQFYWNHFELEATISNKKSSLFVVEGSPEKIHMKMRFYLYQDKIDQPQYRTFIFICTALDKEVEDMDEITSGITFTPFHEKERKKE